MFRKVCVRARTNSLVYQDALYHERIIKINLFYEHNNCTLKGLIDIMRRTYVIFSGSTVSKKNMLVFVETNHLRIQRMDDTGRFHYTRASGAT